MENDSICSNTRTITLDKFKVYAQYNADAAWQDPTITTEPDYVTGMLVHRIESYLWQERGEQLTYEYPKGWWNAFKFQYFPKWALKRWPVEWDKIEVKTSIIYPKLAVSFPRNQHIVWLQDNSGHIATTSRKLITGPHADRFTEPGKPYKDIDD